MLRLILTKVKLCLILVFGSDFILSAFWYNSEEIRVNVNRSKVITSNAKSIKVTLYLIMIFQNVLYITFAESKLGKFFSSAHMVLMSFMIIANDYKSFILNITTCTKRCVTQWIWKLLESFEIYRVRQYLVNLTGLAGTINLRVYKTDLIFSGIGNCLNFNTAFVHARTQN